MNYQTILKYSGVILLGALALGSVWWAVSFYTANQADITKAVEQIAREAALPFHIAELESREEVEELPVPVYDVALADISDTWGAARAEGRTHEGVDIFAERGTPVFSATDGYVRRLNIGSRGGKNVMVAGPGGVNYYYAHFERVAEGVTRGRRVTADTVLGFVGNSGNATGTPPHLHFGIYTEAGNWDAVINPFPLLVDR